MNNLFRHIVAYSLSALLILSTMSFTVDMHFCGRHLVDIGINGKADGCGMLTVAGEHSGMPIAMSPMGCCQDVHYTITGQDNLQGAGASYTITHTIQQDASFVLPPAPFLNIPGERISYRYYQPPPPIGDRLVLFQVFRI